MNNSPDSSPLTPSQRDHLKQEYSELERVYRSLTEDIGRLDVDISRTQQEYHKWPLEEMRAEKVAERDQIAERMRQIEAQLGPDQEPRGPQEPPPIPPKPSPKAPAPPDPPRPTRKVPIWIWYFAILLLGIVLGVVIDSVGRFGLWTCTALWLATALALISGLVILGFSWLPEQRRLHSQKDRIILVVLTLVVSIGLAAYTSTNCQCKSGSIAVTLQTPHGTYVTAWNDENGRDWKLWGWNDPSDPENWKRFELRCVEGGQVTLFTYHHSYVTAMDDSADWVLRGARQETDGVGDSELFTLLDSETKSPLSWSRVIRQLEQNERVNLVFQTAHDRYVTAKNGKEDGDWRIWADERGPIRDQQIFTLIKQN